MDEDESGFWYDTSATPDDEPAPEQRPPRAWRMVARGLLALWGVLIIALLSAVAFALAWNNKSAALLGLKRDEEALALFDECVHAEPVRPHVQAGRGLALIHLERWAEAVAAPDQARTLGLPDDALDAEELGAFARALRTVGREEEARQAEERARSRRAAHQ